MSTTNKVDNGKVTQYCGVVSAHIVAGTGFFSDLAAGLSDFFGGRSGSYQRQLESLYDDALEELSNKAKFLGANGILGLTIDMDNISGKGMSMFMITAVGTAAKIEFDDKKQIDLNNQGTVSSELLLTAIEKREILQILDDSKTPLPSKKWETILKYPDNEYVVPVLRRYFEIDMMGAQGFENEYNGFVNNIDAFIQIADRKTVIQVVYAKMKGSDSDLRTARMLIRKHQLFDAKFMIDLLKTEEPSRTISILEVEQPSYSESDLKNMEALIEALDNLPDQGKIEMVKGGVFSKDKDKFICACGHKNNPEEEYCSECGRNIKGLRESEVDKINAFKNRVSVLKELLSQ